MTDGAIETVGGRTSQERIRLVRFLYADHGGIIRGKASGTGSRRRCGPARAPATGWTTGRPRSASAYPAVKRSQVAHFAHSTDPYCECFHHFAKI